MERPCQPLRHNRQCGGAERQRLNSDPLAAGLPRASYLQLLAIYQEQRDWILSLEFSPKKGTNAIATGCVNANTCCAAFVSAIQ